MTSPYLRSLAIALLPLGLLTAGCSSSVAPSAATTTAAPSSVPRADVTINVVVSEGVVTPSGATIAVTVGQSVAVEAISDVEEEVHVHGYDKELQLAPGKPASVVFIADVKGTFEVETHKSGKLVAKLVVS
ncbi:cupredoxin domain-containing protein [Kribbella sp. NPDC055071]